MTNKTPTNISYRNSEQGKTFHKVINLGSDMKLSEAVDVIGEELAELGAGDIEIIYAGVCISTEANANETLGKVANFPHCTNLFVRDRKCPNGRGV